MKTIYETTGNGYEKQGDYFLPNIKVDDETEYHIGVWGQRYRRYLKQNHKVLYYNYLTSGTLNEHLSEDDNRAEEMFKEFVKALAEKEDVTEKLKEKDMMLWVKRMNEIQSRVREIIYAEIIYN